MTGQYRHDDENKSNPSTPFHRNKQIRKDYEEEDVVPLIFRTHTTATTSFSSSSSSLEIATPYLWMGRMSFPQWMMILSLALGIMMITIILSQQTKTNIFGQTLKPSSSWSSDTLLLLAACDRYNRHVQMFEQLVRDQQAITTTFSPLRCTNDSKSTTLDDNNNNNNNASSSSPSDCFCENPTIPTTPLLLYPEYGMKLWNMSFTRNLDLVKQHQQQQQQQKDKEDQRLDVVLLGDSITERWVGTELSLPLSNDKTEYEDLFQSLFTTKHASKPASSSSESADSSSSSAAAAVQGLALGIAGDQTTDLLFRIQNGELGTVEHYPKVWWILIGINNLMSSACTKEVVLVALIRIIQELQLHQQLYRRYYDDGTPSNKRHAMPKIVINSVLPVASASNRRQFHPVHWPSIQWINHRLECYMQGLDDDRNIVFFNATDIFVVRGTDGIEVDPILLPDGLHPSPKGQAQWGRRIVETVVKLTTHT